MKFGIFFELSVPRPLTRDQEQVVYRNALEQARLADELGFDSVWAVEHHFLEEYSHCSAPEVFLAAVATRTDRIRVGHGAVVCVPQMNHPLRVAERAAALDIISGGRLEFGTARASTYTELGGFRADPDTTKMSWDEYVHILPRLWTEERVSYEGATFSFPERSVIPKPMQTPHPPMWVTVTTPGTELDAADRGIGCLGVAAASFAEQERRTSEYRKRIQLCNPVSSVVNDQVSTLNFLYCHPDDAVATSVGGKILSTFGVLNNHLLWTREVFPTRAYQSLGNLAPGGGGGGRAKGSGERAGESPAEQRPIPDGIGVGDPDRIADAIKVWESIGVDGINFFVNAAEVVSQEDVLASMRLFAGEVMPRFRTSGPAAGGSSDTGASSEGGPAASPATAHPPAPG